MLHFFKKRKNFFLSRKKRIATFQVEDEKKRFGFSVFKPIAVAKNIPAQYAGSVFGRPFRKVHFPFSYFIAAFLLVVLVLYILFFSSVFRVRKIVLVNNHVLMEDDVVKFLEERNIYEKNLILLNDKQLKTVLMDYYKRLEDVRVFKALPGGLRIKVKEKPSTISWITNEKRYLLDQNGVVLGEASESDLGMPRVVDQANIPINEKDKLTTGEFIDFVNIVDETLKRRFGLGVTSYSINNTTFDLKAHINSGFYLVFDTTQDPSEQFGKLQKLYEHGDIIKEYAILSIDGKIIVK